MKKLVVAVVLALATVNAACGSDSSTSSSGTSGAPPANGVTVSSNTFTPASISIKAGDTVTWTWAGGNHDVTSGANCTNDNVFTKSALQSTNGATFQQKFDKAGTFEYFCTPHCAGGMKGKVVVQ
jgi:plastocyanin